jgi:hypothetical protein
LKGWLLDWIGKADADQVTWMFTMMYKLWLARNDARESKLIDDPKAIATRTVFAVEEWRSIQQNMLVSQMQNW